MGIKIYTAKHCPPCRVIEEIIKEGKLTEEIELIDIETDSGFDQFVKEVLSVGEGAVPSAYKDGQRCKILIGEDKELTLDCPTGDKPASGQD